MTNTEGGNPYAAPVGVSDVFSRPRLVYCLARYPCTLFGSAFAAFITSLFLITHFVGFVRWLTPFKLILAPFIYPGVIVSSIAIVITDSLTVALVAYAVSTFGLYGTLGIVMDFIVHRVRERGGG